MHTFELAFSILTYVGGSGQTQSQALGMNGTFLNNRLGTRATIST